MSNPGGDGVGAGHSMTLRRFSSSKNDFTRDQLSIPSLQFKIYFLFVYRIDSK